MADITNDVLDLLKDKYHLRVQLSGGASAKLIGPVHRIYLTVKQKEQKYHLGDEDLEKMVVYLAWMDLHIDLKPTDMEDIKKKLKTIPDDLAPPAL
jgi:hypothetical protein